MNTRPPAVTMPPPRLTDPCGAGPSGTCHFTAPAARSSAASVPNGGGVHGTPSGPNSSSRIIPYGVPRWALISVPGWAWRIAIRLSRGISVTIIATRLVGAMRSPRPSSTATPDQFIPPMLPGQMIVPWSDGGVNTPR